MDDETISMQEMVRHVGNAVPIKLAVSIDYSIIEVT